MEFAYSPHRETGGTLHLPSPTHPHSYHMDGFASIQQIRRSLSRSPSRPSRFHLRSTRSATDTPASPISPLALNRAFSPKPTKDSSPTGCYPVSPLTAAATTSKKKFTLRRTAPFRSSPRNRPKSPRRALVDSTNQGNTTPFMTRYSPGDENTTNHKKSPSPVDKYDIEEKLDAMPMRFDINDEPIKFEFARSRPDTNAPGANCVIPMKSSPLKRSDGIMNLDKVHMGSPVAKRRSLHGPSSLGPDFDVFDYSPAPAVEEDKSRSPDVDMANNFPFSSPVAKTHSPLRKSNSLRKSTLAQRHGSNTPRKQNQDHEFILPGAAASKTRHRFSLDGSLAFGAGSAQTPLRRPIAFESIRPAQQQPVVSLRGGAGHHQPHPLSNQLTPTSSGSEPAATETPTHAPMPAPAAPLRNHGFSRSLPIGATRPELLPNQQEAGSYETPVAYKMAKPLPAAFMSTGLISKRNRDVDLPGPRSFANSYAMPDTPSKRMSFPPITATPSFSRSLFDKPSRPQPQFGTPSTPFSVHAPKGTPHTFGRGADIFGSLNSNTQRRTSFASIDGDDRPSSPIDNHMADSLSSNDELPPTPTKQNDSSGRRSKENSLRSSLFGRRTSLSATTFAPPTADEIVDFDDESPMKATDVSPAPAVSVEQSSPHTPHEAFAPPDPSFLSISGRVSRRDSVSFNQSTDSNASFPPATPTAPRDHGIFLGQSPHGIPPIAGLTKNDVDLSLKSRFHDVSVWGKGEFSEVYRVEQPVNMITSPRASRVWAVKKTKKPYAGPHDREKKLREVRILEALRGHDHIVSITDSWEDKGHLYIQTEFCENGNLKNFLSTAGYDSRLDDFRIWKILLELSQGVQYIHEKGFIHLDLKPANILIDWEGVLKIADFGLASTWPAPPDIDGEGDRNYIAPEVLAGRFDKPADVFAVGVIMCEIAGNIVLPENGDSWQRLRSGDFSELPCLAWNEESSLFRDQQGHPLPPNSSNESYESLCTSDTEDTQLRPFISLPSLSFPTGELAKAPDFMINRENTQSMDNVVHWMMNPNPDDRPVIEQVCRCFGVQWVEQRRRAGATVYEGNWGPSDDVLGAQSVQQVQDADMMDTS